MTRKPTSMLSVTADPEPEDVAAECRAGERWLLQLARLLEHLPPHRPDGDPDGLPED